MICVNEDQLRSIYESHGSSVSFILVSRFMLDLQRVKQQMDGPSLIVSLRSLSFNHFSNVLGSIGATLQPRDIWGDGDSLEADNTEEERCSAVSRDDADLGAYGSSSGVDFRYQDAQFSGENVTSVPETTQDEGGESEFVLVKTVMIEPA